jgi:hypothetical protein
MQGQRAGREIERSRRHGEHIATAASSRNV